MQIVRTHHQFLFSVSLFLGLLFSCKKKTEYLSVPVTVPAFRSSFDYNRLTPSLSYDSLFLDANGLKTVDLTEGNARLMMFENLDTYMKTVVGSDNKTKLDYQILLNYFYNSGSVFKDKKLDQSAIQIRNTTAVSRGDAPIIRADIEKWLLALSVTSDSVNTVASSNKAGRVYAKNGTGYLLDSNGIELGEIVQKVLFGAFQYDYIGNVLMSNSKLNADNHNLVSSKNYTELEHNWDQAFATLTRDIYKVYARTASDGSSGTEKFMGNYLRRFGNSLYGNDYLKIHPAFLRGRAAIVNNDLNELKTQASIIKFIMEKVMARAVIYYLDNWKKNIASDPAVALHGLSEGIGLIYSLRFCKVHGVDDAFSDSLLNDLVYSKPNGVWDLTPAEATTAINKIKSKFSL
jgi:hypothetical protein